MSVPTSKGSATYASDGSPSPRWRYDGFISYCTAADRAFAPKIQDGLEQLAKPWGKRTALDVFQDTDDLAASPDLEAAFQELFKESQTLVFLASPGAAASSWCNDEVTYWIRNRPPEELVVVLTAGTLMFDKEATHPIVFDKSSAAPPAFAELTAVPLYIDMTAERLRTDELDFRSDSDFRAKLTKIAAAVHSNKSGKKVKPRDIDSRDLAEHHKARRLKNLVITALVIISLAAGIAAVVAELQRRSADDGRQIALSKQLASQSAETSDEQLDLGSLLSIEAYRTRQTPEALGSMITAASRSADVALMLRSHVRPIRTVAFNKDGSLLASAGLDGSVVLHDGVGYDTIGSELRPSSSDPTNGPTIREVAFNPTTPVLAAAASDGRVYQWDVSDPTQIVELPSLRSDLHDGRSIQSIAFSPGGDLLITAGGFSPDVVRCTSDTSPVVVHDLVSGGATLLGTVTGCVRGVAFGPTSPLAATAQSDGTITIWDVASPGTSTKIRHAHKSDVQSVTFSADGTRLSSAGSDGVAKVWDISVPTAPVEIASFTRHIGVVRTVAFSPDGTMVASGDRGGQVAIWDPNTGLEIRPLSSRHAGEVRSVAFHPSGRQLASAGADQTVIVWNVDPADRRSISTPLHAGKVRAVAYDSDRSTIITAGTDVIAIDDGTSPGIIWSGIPPDRSSNVVPVHDDVAAIAVDPTTGALASGDSRGNLTMWDPTTREPTVIDPSELGCADVLDGHGILYSLAFHPTSSMLALGFQNGAIMFTDTIVGGDDSARCEQAAGVVWDVAFSPDGERLAASGGNGRVVVWELDSDELTRQVAAAEDVRSLAFDSTGETLAVGGSEGSIVFIDMDSTTVTGQPIRGHEDGVFDLAFRPQGTVLASGGADGTVRLWNTETRTQLTDGLKAYSAEVYSIAWLLDGSGLVSGGSSSARVWDLQPGSLRQSLCDAANRNLASFEWTAYVGADRSYRRTCAAFPPGGGAD